MIFSVNQLLETDLYCLQRTPDSAAWKGSKHERRIFEDERIVLLQPTDNFIYQPKNFKSWTKRNPSVAADNAMLTYDKIKPVLER